MGTNEARHDSKPGCFVCHEAVEEDKQLLWLALKPDVALNEGVVDGGVGLGR